MSARRQFVVFLVCGGVAAFVNLGLRWVLSHFISFSAAIVVAYLTGMVTAYLLFKFFVFDSSMSGRSVSEAIRFTEVNAFSFALVYAFSMLFRWCFLKVELLAPHAEDYAHFLGVTIPAISSYLMHKYWTFSPKRRKAQQQ